MTTTEFSNEFDVLYNNAMSNQAPGLDEYEKSVFLTKAQDQLVKDYFNNRVDGVGGGFDGSQKRQYDFSGLIRVSRLSAIQDYNAYKKIDSRSLVYLFPTDYFLSVNEILEDSKYQYSVIPLQYNDYQRLMMKPYAFPVKKAAWRLFTNKQTVSASITNMGTPEPFPYANTYQAGGNPIYIDTEHPNIATATMVRHPNVDVCTIEAVTENEQDQNLLTFKVSCIPLESGYEITDADAKAALEETLGFLDTETFDYVSPSVLKEAKLLYERLKSGEITTSIVEIIGRFFNKEVPYYQLRYVKSLEPIILVNLDTNPQGLTIRGKQEETQCELPEECHQEILERAVTLAKIAYAGSTESISKAQQKKSND